MPLLRIEHYLALSDDIDHTKSFYCDVLGMREGFRPKLNGVPIELNFRS